MSFNEKSTLSVVLLYAITYVWYIVEVFAGDFSGAVPDTNYRGLMLQMVLFFVVLTIIAHIVIAVLAPIEADDTADERDKSISTRGQLISGWVMTVFVLGALTLSLLEGDAFWVSQILLASLVVAEIFGGLTKLYYYRRGI